MNLNDLSSFVKVVELGTITAAAEAEGVPKSTISRRIAKLEDALGLELLRRAARSFTVTEDGQLLYVRAQGALRELHDVERALVDASDVPRGKLRVTATHGHGGTPEFSALLVDYMSRFPEVQLSVELEERMVDVVREGYDVALRAHSAQIRAEAGLMVRSLSAANGALFATQAYLDAHGTPTCPAELANHRFLSHTGVNRKTRYLVRGTHKVELDTSGTVFEANDFDLIRAQVEANNGIAMLPVEVTARHSAFELVQVLPEWITATGRLSLVWPASRNLSPKVRAFIELAVEHLG